MSPLIVAIDGPSGSGKSTAARGLGRRLEIPYLDTGAMYRAVGLAARDHGVSLPVRDPAAIVELADRLALDVKLTPDATLVVLDGRDVTEDIRAPEISLYASAVSAIPGVRRRLVAEQQRLGRRYGGVLEGRDIGTKVFPDTPHKFFLTAPAAVRAARRTRQLEQRGTPQPYEQVLADIEQRDREDSSRAESPLTLDDRYVVIDSGDKSSEEVVSEMEGVVRSRTGAEKARSSGVSGPAGG
ncbi:MAG: (d)CMP kinase [Thermoanaerobaculia bacterium]